MLAAGDPWIRWDWVERHRDDIAHATWQHLRLTATSVLIGAALSLPLALAAHRWRPVRRAVLAVAGTLYTIPSLALFAFLVPITGLSTTTSVIGLSAYSLELLLRNGIAGLAAVPPEVRENAEAMGFTPTQRILRVDLPLATPFALAGLRLATVSTIGLVTVTSLIGQGGLGALINEGLTRDFRTPLVVGLVGSVVLALAAAAALSVAGRLLTPWTRPHRSRGR